MEKNKRTIFIFWFLADWGRFRRINEIFAREFAEDPKYQKVVAIDSDGNLWTLFKNIRLYFSAKEKKIRKNALLHILKLLSPIPIKDGKKTYVKTLFRIFPRPFYKYSVARYLDYLTLAPQLFLLKVLYSTPPSIGFLFPPIEHSDFIMKFFNFDKIVSYLADDIIARAKEEGESGGRLDYLYYLYKVVLKNSDLDFSLSQELAKTYSDVKPGIYHSPLGVDYEYYQQAKVYDHDLSKLKGPIVGYLGFLGPAMDGDIISLMVKKNPDISFAFAGPVKTGDSFFNKLAEENKNVFLVGPRHFLDVPGFMKSCDVLISPKIPAKCAGGHSRKIYEYLSTGKPLVFTNVPPADKYKDVVYISNTPNGFNRLLQNALQEKDPGKTAKRKSIAEKSSWTRRAFEIKRKIDNLFA